MRQLTFTIGVMLCIATGVMAVEPPELMSYQGVLRDTTSGAPLDGTYAITFRLYDSALGPSPILVDQHGSVEVTDGLFTVEVGGGNVSDGSAPGVYTSLAKVFAKYASLYMEIEVNAEVLLPRTPVNAAGYALNARYVNGMEVASAGPLDLYVDAMTGDDENDGRSPTAAKATIQAAVDAIPGFLGGDVTVYISEGTYAEEVQLYPRSMQGEQTITLSGEPGVVITGEGTRVNGIGIRGIHNFVVENVKVVDTIAHNILVSTSTGTVDSVVLASTGTKMGSGILIARGFVTVRNSTIWDHAVDGITCSGGARCFLDDVDISGNTKGMDVMRGSIARFVGPGVLTGNYIGARAITHGTIDVFSRPDVTVTGNTSTDLEASLQGVVIFYANATVGGCVADAYSVCEP